MAVGDRQRFITEILEKSLNQRAETDCKFDWFVNSHSEFHFGKYFKNIHKIFQGLNGNLFANQNKRTSYLRCDAYFGGKYNFIFEFDEYQHFSSARLATLDNYPKRIKLNFSKSDWRKYCLANRLRADRYRYSKTATDFNFEGGRTAQRAYLDCFRDFLPCENGLNPTLRINEFEVADIVLNNKESQRKLKVLVENKLNGKASL
ncbi:hypothetical protein [Arenibacter troitsensis]|uniref:Uncharacterized protein n=1 Tax=Arenibacter troitsensis TaxID=188872 RepID=A0A1X7KW28_9FLAO|nr:hypothetical protein [Arenibacter troitsensis]SMG45066.1 hypothetical protein SAMN03080602_03405 [Arenibacter troitsensis]